MLHSDTDFMSKVDHIIESYSNQRLNKTDSLQFIKIG